MTGGAEEPETQYTSKRNPPEDKEFRCPEATQTNQNVAGEA